MCSAQREGLLTESAPDEASLTFCVYITLHYTSYLVYASYKKTVHWRITESNIDEI